MEGARQGGRRREAAARGGRKKVGDLLGPGGASAAPRQSRPAAPAGGAPGGGHRAAGGGGGSGGGLPRGPCARPLPAPPGALPGQPCARGGAGAGAAPPFPGRPQHPGMPSVLPPHPPILGDPSSPGCPRFCSCPGGDVLAPGGGDTVLPISILPSCSWGGQRVPCCWGPPRTPAQKRDHPTGGSLGGSPQALCTHQGCPQTGTPALHTLECANTPHPQHTHCISGWTCNLRHLHVHMCACTRTHVCSFPPAWCRVPLRGVCQVFSPPPPRPSSAGIPPQHYHFIVITMIVTVITIII